MANNFAYIEKTLPGVFDEVYFTQSITERFFKNNTIIKGWDAAGRVAKIFNLATSGYTTYNRGGSGNANSDGSVVSRLESFQLSQERYASFLVDKLDSIDDQESVLGHLAKHFADTQHTYELDTYRLSKIASYASSTLGNYVSEAIAANTIYSKISAGFKWLANRHIKKQDIVIFASVSSMALIRESTELSRVLRNDEITSDYNGKKVTLSVENLDGCPIIEVPDDTLYTDAVTGTNGIAPKSTSKLINFLMVDKNAPVAIQHLAWSKVYDSDETDLGYVGNKLAFLLYHDCFVPENKVAGIYASVSTTAATARELLVNAVAGTTTGKTIVKNVLTQPEGIAYDKLYVYTTNGTAPAIGSSTSGLTQVTLGSEITPNASHNIFVASLDGKAVAVSKDFTSTLPVA